MRDYLVSKNNNDERVKRLMRKFNPSNIMETKGGSRQTSYSVNKGEKLVFCLRAKNKQESLVDMNTLTFVALHELAHIMTVSVGHTVEFWKNFKYLLQEAVKIGVYKKVDYSRTPKDYCGMKVTDTPLTDPSL